MISRLSHQQGAGCEIVSFTQVAQIEKKTNETKRYWYRSITVSQSIHKGEIIQSSTYAPPSPYAELIYLEMIPFLLQDCSN